MKPAILFLVKNLSKENLNSAIINSIKQNMQHRLTQVHCKNLKEAIASIFIWDETTEGFYYWYKIANKIEE